MIVGLAVPSSRRRFPVDLQALLFILLNDLMPVSERLGVIRSRAVERFTRWRYETNRAVIEHQDDDVSFVDLSVMKTAETHQVRQLRLSPMRPVLHVMPIEITRVRATRKATTPAISRPHRPV